MKLGVDVNEVTLSNTGEVGEFRIRNSAKAFKILSDGLYSNKIRAIIRELSCNAIDSHVGAGKTKVPFELHLPTMFEPWFAVRDFGLGLDDKQVKNIYTTYFESTKTDSNDFIGALGLGSKSPFSYTENFTVTAVKNGTKRIYSAFINEKGVPSIAEMGTSSTDEVNGVEVKFSVTNQGDYRAFQEEARNVFMWFKNRPTVLGVDEFKFQDVEYGEKDIVKGIHTFSDNHSRYNRQHSVALMGNIVYPLNNIPNIEKNLKGLGKLLECSLIIEFEIGELDFAASREQLSYVPLTLDSIYKKLQVLNANLVKHITEKVAEIPNSWLKACYLHEMLQESLFNEAVKKYVTDTKFPLIDLKNSYGIKKSFVFPIRDLSERDLSIIAFRSSGGQCSRINTSNEYIDNGKGSREYTQVHTIEVTKDTIIVLNDLKTGCSARARHHFNKVMKNATVICLSHDAEEWSRREKEYNKFLMEIHNPPVVIKASDLEKPIKAKPVSSTGIMYIRTKSQARIGNDDSYTWESYKEEIDENTTYYYVALNGHKALSKDGTTEINLFQVKAWMDLCGVDSISKIKILGVRKSRIKELSELDNWVWFEDKLKEETTKISDKTITNMILAEMFDGYYNRVYTNAKVAKMVDSNSFYAKYVDAYGNAVKRNNGNSTVLSKLCGQYGKSVQVEQLKKKIEDDKKELFVKYPFLKLLRNDSDMTEKEVAEYINMVDNRRKTK